MLFWPARQRPSSDVPETCRCCTEGHGLVGSTGDRWAVGLDGLQGLFQPWRFIIPCGEVLFGVRHPHVALSSFSSMVRTAQSLEMLMERWLRAGRVLLSSRPDQLSLFCFVALLFLIYFFLFIHIYRGLPRLFPALSSLTCLRPPANPVFPQRADSLGHFAWLESLLSLHIWKPVLTATCGYPVESLELRNPWQFLGTFHLLNS